LEALEDRRLLSVTLPVIGSQLVQAGAPLNLALSATGTVASDPIVYSYSISNSSSANPNLTATIPTGNTFLKLHVDNGDNIHGDMVFELYNDLMPNTVQVISSLVNAGFYNGLTFHRKIEDFMIQGGDPNGNGTGGPGFQFADEFNSALKFTSSGILAMANAGPNTNGSQFFITAAPTRWLDNHFNLFGFLVQGEEIRQKLDLVPTDISDRPINTVTITNASIITDTSDAVLRLSAPSGAIGTAIVTITATDTITNETATRSFNVYVEPDVSYNNHAPVLVPASSSPTLGSTTLFTPKTINVSSFINNGANTTTITDADPGAAVGGIAITSLSGMGTWKYSLDSLSFVTIDASKINVNSALLLPKDAALLYAPDGMHSETPGITYVAWDMTFGNDGQLAHAQDNVTFAITAFSNASDHATLNVLSNTAPVLTLANPAPAIGPTMGSTTKDLPFTTSISSFINNGDGTTSITDSDSGAVVGGIAITATYGSGTWQFSLDGGSTFLAFSPIADASTSLLLPHDALLRYMPVGLVSEHAIITYHAWDMTSGGAGMRADLTASSSHGGTTAFSDGYDSAVINVNDAPVLTSAHPFLGATTEEMPITIPLINSFINHGEGTTTIFDLDQNATVGGIAIIGITGNGIWEYKPFINSSYQPIGLVSLSSALTLSKSASGLRYTPDGKHGETATITYLAWDYTTSANNKRVDLSQPGSTGGTTAFSTASDTASIFVTDSNNAPVLTPANPVIVIAPNNTPVTFSLSSTFINHGTGTTMITDVDIGDVVGGIALVGVTGNGRWDYSLDYGNMFFTINKSEIGDASALLLPHDAKLRYIPGADNAVPATITYRAWDTTSGCSGDLVDLSQASALGGSTAFSLASDTLLLTALNINDPPTDISLANASVSENQAAGTSVGAFAATDPNAGDTFTYSLVSGTGSGDNASFSISGDTLQTNAMFDFEMKSVYNIRVRVTDQGGLWFEKPLTIWVEDQSEIFSAAANNWTNAGLTLKLDTDGKLHLYRTGTATDAVPPQNPAFVTSINLLGRDGADDILTVDLAEGNPIPAGGMVFNGGTHLKGDKLSLKGTADYDNVTLTKTQVNVAGSAAINYSQVEFMGFDLGDGFDHLAIDHATLRIDQDNAISAGTDVTILGGTLDLNGRTNTLGDVKLISGSIQNGSLNAASYNILSGNVTAALSGSGALTKTTTGQFTAGTINASNVTVSAGSLSATSIVCDTLTIGSASGKALSAVMANELSSSTVPSSEAMPPLIGESLNSTTTADAAIEPTSNEETAVAVQSSMTQTSEISALDKMPILNPSWVVVPQNVASVLHVMQEKMEPLNIFSLARLPESMEQRDNKPISSESLSKENFASEFSPVLNLAARFAPQCSLSSTTLLTQRVKDFVSEEISNSLAGMKKLPSPSLSANQNAHHFALESLMREFQQKANIDTTASAEELDRYCDLETRIIKSWPFIQ
jgi:cyclophilin family peptidyl-prolyl cis-trans isomerase